MNQIKKYSSLKVYLDIKNGVHIKDLNNMMSIFISDVMNRNQYLKDLHTGKGYKHYSFSTPYSNKEKLEGDCNFEIRSFDKEIIMNFAMALTGYESDWIKVKDLHIVEYVFGGRITKIKTITPSVAIIHPKTLKENNIEQKYKSTYWTNKMSIELLKQSIITNLQNKYNDLTGSNIKIEDVIKDIKIKNEIPIGINYSNKGATLLGNKLEVEFKHGKQSQIAARMATVEGLLEKNSILGLGFVRPTYEKVVI